MRASLHAMIGAATLLAAVAQHSAAAFDSMQFCKAVTQLVRAAAGDVGTWIDRTTRNDGVEIFCARRLVHFTRYSSKPASGLSDEWKERETREWRSAYCARPTWAEAVDNGWIISATVTTVTGQKVWFACQKGGNAFHRMIP
jgi:hypothetical protein